MFLFELVTIFGRFFVLIIRFFVFICLKSLKFCTFDVADGLKFNLDLIFLNMNQTTDWKDILGKAFDLPTDTDTTATESQPDKGDALQQQGKQMLDIVLERKGRGGKQATIVTGFNCDDEALKQVASQLKRALSVGGSARGGEILIQGDLRQRVLDQLKQMGFKARII